VFVVIGWDAFPIFLRRNPVESLDIVSFSIQHFFYHITEAHVQHDIALCHEALMEQNTAKLVQASRDVLGRGHRVAQIAKKAMTSTANPLFKGELLTATEELKTGNQTYQIYVSGCFIFVGFIYAT
jgi:hypothetical protein